MLPLFVSAKTTLPPPAAYNTTVLQDSPYAYYRLNETSGTTAADSSGNGRNGTYAGSNTKASVALLPSSGLKYVSLAGTTTTSYVNISASYNFGSSSTWSVEFWTNSTAFEGNANTGSNAVSYLSNQTGSSSANGLNVFTNTSQFGYWPASYQDAYWNCGFSLNTTYYVVFTFNNGVMKCYMNGQPLTFTGHYAGGGAQSPTDSNIPNMTLLANSLWIGRQSVLGGALKGSIGEVALYTTELSAARVAEHYRAGVYAG